MSTHAFTAMGTTFWLRVEGVHQDVLPCAERFVRVAEARLSRFLPGSALSRLNTERVMSDPMLAAVAREAMRARVLTRGAFDATLGAALVAAGYDRSFERLPPNPGTAPVEHRELGVGVEGDTVRLTGAGMLDLGGIAKGWTVDRVAEQLAAAGATGWVVDGGGDIRVGGQAPGADARHTSRRHRRLLCAVPRQGLAQPPKTSAPPDPAGNGAGGGQRASRFKRFQDVGAQSCAQRPGWPPEGEWCLGIGDDYAIGLVMGAVATSSSRKRRWLTVDGEGHHILDPRTGRPSAGDVDTAVVVASDAITADVLATALIADFDAAWPALGEHGAAALVHAGSSGWRMTPNLEELLR